MARRPRRENEEIVETIYGIDPKTFEVARLSLTRGGTLTRWWGDGRVYPHHIEHGRSARSEAIVVFGLMDILSVPALLDGADSTKASVKKLEEKAAEMKRKAEETTLQKKED